MSRILHYIALMIFTLPVTGRALVDSPSDPFEAYIENSYLSREEVHFTSSRLRWSGKSTVAPFVQLGTESMWGEHITADQSKISGFLPGSYGYASIGMARQWLGPTARTAIEIRRRDQYRDSVALSTEFVDWDARLSGVLGTYHESTNAVFGWRPTFETYSEGIFTSADQNNLIGAAFWRTGVFRQWSRTSNLRARLELENWVGYDRVGWYYNRRADVKAGLGLSWGPGSWIVALTYARLYNQYFGNEVVEQRPDLADLRWGHRMLFAASGIF